MKQASGTRMFTNPNKGSRGAILIEVILAMLIMSVGLTVIIQSMVEGLWAKTISEDYSRAALLADSRMLEVLAQGPLDRPLSEQGQFSQQDSKYHYDLKTQELDDTGKSQNNIHQVTLQISWKSGMNQKEITLVTYQLKSPQK